MEFNDQKTAKKILETPNLRLQGIHLSLTPASRNLASLLSSAGDNDDTDDEDDDSNAIKTSPTEHIPSPIPVRSRSLSSRQEIIQQPTVPLGPIPIAAEPIFVPSAQ